MRDRIDEFGEVAIAAVTFAPPDDLAVHRAHLGVPFPLLSDPDREVYRRFELGRGSLRDIYSLGTSFYHLLTGRPPFQGANALAIYDQILEGRLAFPKTFNLVAK